MENYIIKNRYTGKVTIEGKAKSFRPFVELHKADLSGADLSGANLYGTNLYKAEINNNQQAMLLEALGVKVRGI